MTINQKQPGHYGYVAFYGNKRAEVYGLTLWDAKKTVMAHFKVPEKKSYQVTVTLAEQPDGTEVVHTPDF